MDYLLVKYIRTDKQESRLLRLLMCDWNTKVLSRPSLYNENLLIKIIDDKGMEYFREMNKEGNMLPTNYYF